MSVVKTGTGLKTFVMVCSQEVAAAAAALAGRPRDGWTDGRTEGRVPPQTPTPPTADQSLWRAGKLQKHGANASVGFVCAAFFHSGAGPVRDMNQWAEPLGCNLLFI